MKKNLLSTFLFLFASLAMCQSSFAQMGKVDSRYISETSFFVIQFDIEKLISYEKMGSKDIETIATFLKKEAKFDLMNLKTVTLQFGDGSDPSEFDEDAFAVVMKFKKPIDNNGFLEGIGAEYEDAEFDGQKFHQSGNEYQPSVFFPDDKTIVMAHTESLKSLMKEKSGEAPISGMLNSAAPGSEIIGAFQNSEAFTNILAELNNAIPVSPINIEKVYGEAESGFLQAQIKSSTPIYIQLNCKSEKGAKTIAKKTKLAVDLGKASIPLGRDALKEQIKQIEAGGGGFPADFKDVMKAQFESMNTALDAAEKLLNGTSTASNGKTATVKVKMMGGAKEIVMILVKTIGGQFSAMSRMQSEFEGELERIDEDVEEAIKGIEVDDADEVDK